VSMTHLCPGYSSHSDAICVTTTQPALVIL
jgi:hypothetical protein